MIEISQLTKRYGDLSAIKNLNFSVNKGEIVGFLGPNGAGKTTTMKIITGFMAPTEGNVKVCGFDVFDSPLEIKKRIGYLPETPPLYTEMIVEEYLRYVAKLKGMSGQAVKNGVEYAIAKTNLTDVRRRLIKNLSKGFRQRVGIAQALVHNPEVLVLDEPTVGLDPKQVIEIRNLVKELAGAHTVILSTHVLSEVTATCNRIIIISNGEIVAEDTYEGLSRRMSASRRFLVRVRRNIDQVHTQIETIKGVRSLKKVDGQSFEVDAEKDDAIYEAITDAVVKSGAGLMEFKGMDVSLEDIFLKLTSDNQGVQV